MSGLHRSYLVDEHCLVASAKPTGCSSMHRDRRALPQLGLLATLVHLQLWAPPSCDSMPSEGQDGQHLSNLLVKCNVVDQDTQVPAPCLMCFCCCCCSTTAGVVKDLADGASAMLGLPMPAMPGGRPGRNLLAADAPLADVPVGFDAPAFRGAVMNALQVMMYSRGVVLDPKVAAALRVGAPWLLHLQLFTCYLSLSCSNVSFLCSFLPRCRMLP